MTCSPCVSRVGSCSFIYLRLEPSGSFLPLMYHLLLVVGQLGQFDLFEIFKLFIKIVSGGERCAAKEVVFRCYCGDQISKFNHNSHILSSLVFVVVRPPSLCQSASSSSRFFISHVELIKICSTVTRY